MTASGAERGLLVGVDRAVFTAAVVGQLRDVGLGAGVGVGLPAAERLAAALESVQAPTRRDLYWVLRLSIVQHHDDLERFDAWYEAVFGSDPPPTAPGRGTDTPASSGDTQVPVRRRLVDGESAHGGLPWATTTPTVGLQDDEDDEDASTPLAERVPSTERALDATAFDLLDPEQLAEVGERLETLFDRWPTRPSRRRRSSRNVGAVDLRRTLAASRRTGGETMELIRRRPGRRPRPVVALLDVSGSMESYATAYLHLLRVLARHRRAEVFAFGTDLTRLTPTLRLRSVDEAMELATDEVVDRFGGTRIASSIGALLEHRVWGSTVRGAEVLVVSDGWDTDPPEELARRCAALSRRAHRLVWINPRVASAGFEPRVAGMAAAAGHCDALVSGHSLDAMGDVIDLLVDGRRSTVRA